MDHAASFERTLGIYAEGLDALRGALPVPALGAAADAILAMRGRLIVSGMGKSGHVGRKLAATFASTGTPAHFVHPAEASHGDLGMIAPGDVLMMLSWSGETRELSDLIAHAKRRRVTSVALTGAAEGTLARRSDVAIVLPEVREACPMRLAPTTSTLLQLAAGDALAVAVLEGRGFDAAQFRAFHPGGKLGAALTRIEEIMHVGEALPLLPEGASMLEAVGEISRKGLGIVGLVRADGTLAGVLTDGDVRRYLEANIAGRMAEVMGRAAAGVMTREPVVLDGDRLSQTALAVLQERRISAAFVTEAARPRGLVTILQLLRAGVA